MFNKSSLNQKKIKNKLLFKYILRVNFTRCIFENKNNEVALHKTVFNFELDFDLLSLQILLNLCLVTVF